MLIGHCPLCLRDGVEIQQSHYIPAALYPKRLPLEYLSPKGVGPLTGEIKGRLLCFDCEQRFSRLGEAEVLGHIAGKIANKPSLLLTKLERLAVVEEDQTLKSYRGSDAGLNMEMFAYFALSMAWRSTFPWVTLDGNETKPLKLGLFKEPIRRFLAGETSDFPRDVAVTVIVCTDKTTRQSWVLPSQSNDDVWFSDIMFHAFGVRFRVTFGKSMPSIVRRESCHLAKLIHSGDCENRTREALQFTQRPL